MEIEMRFRIHALTFLMVLFVVTGCVTRVVSNVTTFSNLPANYVGSTIAVVAYPPEKNEGLAWRNHRTIFENELRKKGFRVTNAEAPDYVAIVSYGIDDGTTTTSLVSTPVYGQTGGGTTTHSGTISSYSGGYSSYYGTSYTQPTYGIVGTRTSTVSETVFKRAVTVNIEDHRTKERVFEGTLKSGGSCRNMMYILPYLTSAMFQKFPQPYDGTVEAPSKGNC
jgi:hypothetical protein